MKPVPSGIAHPETPTTTQPPIPTTVRRTHRRHPPGQSQPQPMPFTFVQSTQPGPEYTEQLAQCTVVHPETPTNTKEPTPTSEQPTHSGQGNHGEGTLHGYHLAAPSTPDQVLDHRDREETIRAVFPTTPRSHLSNPTERSGYTAWYKNAKGTTGSIEPGLPTLDTVAAYLLYAACRPVAAPL